VVHPAKQGGLVLILLAIALLLVGGGFFPPVIALVSGLAGTQINRPLRGKPGGLTRFVAKMWPWPLVLSVYIAYAHDAVYQGA
jgi:hypothetical protein